MKTKNETRSETSENRGLPSRRHLCLVLLLLLPSCGENESPVNPTEKVAGTITYTQLSTFTQPTYSVVKSPEGVVKRVYGIWGEVGDTVVIEDANTF